MLLLNKVTKGTENPLSRNTRRISCTLPSFPSPPSSVCPQPCRLRPGSSWSIAAPQTSSSCWSPPSWPWACLSAGSVACRATIPTRSSVWTATSQPSRPTRNISRRGGSSSLRPIDGINQDSNRAPLPGTCGFLLYFLHRQQKTRAGGPRLLCFYFVFGRAFKKVEIG